MRKVFIFTGLLLGLALLACLIRFENPRLLKPGFLKSIVMQPGGQGLQVPDPPFPEPAGKVFFARNGDKPSTPVTEEHTSFEKSRLQLEKIRQLESICSECRLVIDKSQLEDSVYDLYDNPEGRLNRYQVDFALRRFFNASGALRVARLQLEELKRQNRER